MGEGPGGLLLSSRDEIGTGGASSSCFAAGVCYEVFWGRKRARDRGAARGQNAGLPVSLGM